MATASPLAPALANAPRLSADRLVKRFGARTAVDGISFDAAPGEVLGFLGPNGAGKTTLFHLLTGLLAPDGGTMSIDGTLASPVDPKVRARLGVVFQSPSLDPQLTGRENLYLGAALYSIPRARARARGEEMLRLMELADRADERVGTWSGGMRRRLELARSLMHDPSIFVMDEPTQGLDQASFHAVWRHVLDRVRATGMTVLLTTHRPEEAEHCDRICVIASGKVVACDTPAELKKKVGGDVIALETEDAPALARDVAEKFGAKTRVDENTVLFEVARGHELVPRIVEAFPAGRLKSVSLRRPTLGDVFLTLTGKRLEKDE